MADDRDIVYMAGALGFGVWGFFWGFVLGAGMCAAMFVSRMYR